MGTCFVMDRRKTFFDMLDRLFSCQTTQEEHKSLDSISSREGVRMFNEYSRTHWDESQDFSLPTEQSHQMHNDIMNRVSALEDFKRHDASRTLHTLWGVAAAVCLVVVGALIGYTTAQHNIDVQTYEVVAERGQQSTLTLPDGSYVKLNSESSLTYTSDFNTSNRALTLSGEAYFEVAPNKKIPFVVMTNEMEVKALGTKFNVRAYNDEAHIVATLVEGKIQASTSTQNIIISPNMASVFNRNTNTLSIRRVTDVEHAIPWLKNEIVFSGETLAQVAKILERLYDVEIEFENEEITSYEYHGLVRNNALSNILSLIVESSPVEYSQHGNQIVLSKRK